MTSKKALSSPSLSALASRTLKTVGIIAVLYSLHNVITPSMPYQVGDRQWQISFVSRAVDSGVLLLMGLVLVPVGFWVDAISEGLPDRKLWQDLRLYAFGLASLLGLLFLLMFPLHLYNVSNQSDAAKVQYESALKQVNQQATTAQGQLEARLQQEIGSRRQQITQLLDATDEQLTQLEQAGQLSKEQADLIRKFKADRNGVEPFLKGQEGTLRQQATAEIDKQKQQAEASLKTEAQRLQMESLQSGLRIGISSLLLAIGYAVIGWTGLRNLRQ